MSQKVACPLMTARTGDADELVTRGYAVSPSDVKSDTRHSEDKTDARLRSPVSHSLTASIMSSGLEDTDPEPEPRHRDLGLTVASAFFRNRPKVICVPCEEKKILLDSWATKAEHIRRLYEHFEDGISRILQDETDVLVQNLVEYVKSQTSSTFGYIPTAIIRHGLRMTDRDAVFDLIERGLSSSACAAEVVRLDASHTTDIESVKRKIIADLMTDELFSKMAGSQKVRRTYAHRLPFKYFAQSFACHRSDDKRRPVIILIEELERADGHALTAFFAMMRNSMTEMPVVVMLGCCTSHLSLQQLLPASAYDMLFVKAFQTASAKTMFVRVMNEILMSSDVYSFKLGPVSLRLVEDNFSFFNFSLEKVLSIIKLMIIRHVGQSPCPLLTFTTPDELKQALVKMSKSELKQLRAEVMSLPSVASVLPELKQMGSKDADSFRKFIKRSVTHIHECHKDFLISMKCLSVLSSSRRAGAASDRVESVSIAPFVSIIIPDDGDITDTNEFKNIQRSLSALCLDELKTRLEACINNHLSTDSSIAHLLKKEYENLLQLEKDVAISSNSNNKHRSTSSKRDSNDRATSSAGKSQSGTVSFEGCKSRHEWKARLKDSLSVSRSDTRENVSTPKKRSKFEEFRSSFVSNVCHFFGELTPPFSLPLHEVIYFSDSTFVADHYFPSTRTTIIESLRHPLALRLSSKGETGEGDETSDHELDVTRIYKQLASSSSSISMFDLMQSLQAQKASTSQQEAQDADVSPRKKARKSKGSTDKERKRMEDEERVMVEERRRFFTLINDMEYIGVVQKDKRKAGRLTKLVWEAE